MKINFFQFEELEGQKHKLREGLKLSPQIRLDLAFDGVHAFNDLTRSLADLYPHKRSMAVLGSQPPPLREIVAGLAGQGFSIQELPVSLTAPDPSRLQTAWDALKRDTLFVLSAAAEPLTGALYPFEWVRDNGPKKNIFSLIYFSPDALEGGWPTPGSPYEGLVLDPLWGADFGLAAVLRGERCQGERLLWGQPHFSDGAVSAFEKAMLAAGTKVSRTDAPAVRAFEKKIAARLKRVALLHDDCARIFDRAVLFVEGAHGDALVYALKEQGDLAFTGAACAWKNPHLNSWLPKMGLTAEQVESSLIIPLETLHKEDFEDRLAVAVEKLRKTSGF